MVRVSQSLVAIVGVVLSVQVFKASALPSTLPSSTSILASSTSGASSVSIITALTGFPLATPPPEIPKDRIFTAEDVVVKSNSTDKDKVPDLKPVLPDGNVTIILPPSIDANNPGKFADLHKESLNQALPFLLDQYAIPKDKIQSLTAEGIPVINEALLALLSGDVNSDDPDVRLRARFLGLDKVVKWVKGAVHDVGEAIGDGAEAVGHALVNTAEDVGCGIFASSALPGYLLYADLFKVQNAFSTSYPTSSDQDFYVYPLHGPISHQDNIRVYYRANFPPGFGNAEAVSMGRIIYTREGVSSRVATDAKFKNATKILLHEFTHTKQYQARGYSLHQFGLKYLFEFCKAGFSYKKDKLEVEAYRTQEYMNALLVDPIGSQFITIWRNKKLQNSLGLPVARTFVKKPWSVLDLNKRRYTLAMQRGTLLIRCDWLNKCT